MTPETEQRIRQIAKEVIKDELSSLFGRSIVQIKQFFLANIK